MNICIRPQITRCESFCYYLSGIQTFPRDKFMLPCSMLPVTSVQCLVVQINSRSAISLCTVKMDELRWTRDTTFFCKSAKERQKNTFRIYEPPFTTITITIDQLPTYEHHLIFFLLLFGKIIIESKLQSFEFRIYTHSLYSSSVIWFSPILGELFLGCIHFLFVMFEHYYHFIQW